MAGKSRRVAARQSQLNRRRKKQTRGPSGIPSAVSAPSETAASGTSSDEEGAASNGAVATAETAQTQPAPARSARPNAPAAPMRRSRSQGMLREETLPAYQYMGPEIRRIAAMAATAFVVLVVLKFVL